MLEYMKLFLRYLSINAKSIMVYDIDYLFGIVSMAIKSAVNFCMVLLLFCVTDSINGWTFNQMLFLYGLSTVSFALWHCFFINIITIPYYIQTGEFDRYLLKPIDPLFQIMMESFDDDGWGELILGIVILIISVAKNSISLAYVALLPVCCVCGCLIFAGLSIICSSVAFFTIGHIDLTDNVMDFKEFAKYPLTIFSGGIRFVFSYIIPIGFTAYYPSLIILNKEQSTFGMAFLAVPISIIFLGISWVWWHFSLQKYNSSGH